MSVQMPRVSALCGPQPVQEQAITKEGNVDDRPTLQTCLRAWQPENDRHAAASHVIEALAKAAVALSHIIAAGPLVGITGRTGNVNPDGDTQKDIDVAADRLFRDALRTAPVAAVLSEEAELPETFDARAPLCVAIDPLDGSANLENNISVGTIFAIRPLARDIISTFFEPGTVQCAAGCFIYGPQTVLVLALDRRVDLFILDPKGGEFVRTVRGIRIPPDTAEFAINASNRRHWSGAVRIYIDECTAGAAGDRGLDFNMRWIGSLVAEAYRILVRGGVFLYPADARPAYREGRLRLLYEAHPIALIMEWAGGAASSGRARILELSARTPHQRVPLIMGSARAVRDVEVIHEGAEPRFESSDAPLFARRGLFR
jgi:fructose-1,6-bisphosphatase I